MSRTGNSAGSSAGRKSPRHHDHQNWVLECKTLLFTMNISLGVGIFHAAAQRRASLLTASSAILPPHQPRDVANRPAKQRTLRLEMHIGTCPTSDRQVGSVRRCSNSFEHPTRALGGPESPWALSAGAAQPFGSVCPDPIRRHPEAGGRAFGTFPLPSGSNLQLAEIVSDGSAAVSSKATRGIMRIADAGADEQCVHLTPARRPTNRIMAPASITGAGSNFTVIAKLYDDGAGQNGPWEQFFLAWSRRDGPDGTCP